jgi:hypothetical protein
VRGKSLKLSFPNGWTANAAPDTLPAYYNIMAWPTRQDNHTWECVRFYVWQGDEKKIDVRLFSMIDLIDRLAEIATAEPPPP